MNKTIIYPAKNAEEFDLLIIGNGLHASLLLASAVGKGLNVALIAESDCAENSFQSPFIFIEPVLNYQFYQIPFRNWLIKSLQKSFAHLFIASNTDNYQKNTLIKSLIFKLYNLFSVVKIETQNKIEKVNFPYFSYKCYKFSSIRMAVALFKKAVQLGAKIHTHSNIHSIEFTDNQNYIVQFRNKVNNQFFEINCKNILSFNLSLAPIKINGKKVVCRTNVFFYFTYPSDKLKLEKNIIIQKESEYLKIIPWFDLVYFEFSNSGNEILSLENTIQFINKYFNDILIDKAEILTFGNARKPGNSENKKKVQLIYLNNNKQIDFKYKSVIQWFKYSNRICNTIITQIKKGDKSNSSVGNIIFPGSDLPETIHPLRIMEYVDDKYDQAKQILKSPQYFKKLFYTYGSDIEMITEKAYEFWNETKDSLKSWLKAEIWYSINHEFCISAEDFINNRSENRMFGNQINKDEIILYFKELGL